MKKTVSYRRRCLASNNGTGLSHYILLPQTTKKN